MFHFKHGSVLTEQHHVSQVARETAWYSLRFWQSCSEKDEVVYLFGLRRVKVRNLWWGGGQPGLHQISYVKINCFSTALPQSLKSWCGRENSSWVRLLTGNCLAPESGLLQEPSSHVSSWQQEHCHDMPWDTSSWWFKMGSWTQMLIVDPTDEFSWKPGMGRRALHCWVRMRCGPMPCSGNKAVLLGALVQVYLSNALFKHLSRGAAVLSIENAWID